MRMKRKRNRRLEQHLLLCQRPNSAEQRRSARRSSQPCQVHSQAQTTDSAPTTSQAPLLLPPLRPQDHLPPGPLANPSTLEGQPHQGPFHTLVLRPLGLQGPRNRNGQSIGTRGRGETS
jgi:hypothetical protein